jgi:hypothetical protein
MFVLFERGKIVQLRLELPSNYFIFNPVFADYVKEFVMWEMKFSIKK